MSGIQCMLMRGGTSKGAYFLANDLPDSPAERDELLLRLMGSPDERQIDGIGGANPLTSKVAVVSVSNRPDADVDYLFLQVSVDQPVVSDRQNCGNILAGVGPFAVERGLVPTHDNKATVRIYLVNTDSVATATFPVVNGAPVYDGHTAIDGVPGTAAAVILEFEGIAGGSCGALLPTGNMVDTIDGVDVTLIDNGMPVVVMRSDDLGVIGTESPAQLEANGALRARLESIRLQAGHLMNLGDVADTTVPKLTMVSAPTAGGDLSTRTFIPHRCHDAIGVLGAVSVATAALLPASPAASVLRRGAGADGTIVCEHPSGSFIATLELDHSGTSPHVRRAGIVRTARKLMDGAVFPRPRLAHLDERHLMSATPKSIPGPHPSPHAPRRWTPPTNATDAHCHVFGPACRFPFADDRSYTPPIRASTSSSNYKSGWACPAVLCKRPVMAPTMPPWSTHSIAAMAGTPVSP
ncbi:MAG: 4-oxalomesaconate tautomerase [Acidimicrobiales bacterium]